MIGLGVRILLGTDLRADGSEEGEKEGTATIALLVGIRFEGNANDMFPSKRSSSASRK